MRRARELGLLSHAGLTISPSRSHHVVTPAHPAGSYVPDIPAAPAADHADQEPDMTITPTTLTRAAGVAAVAAGVIFIGVQINHPTSTLDSVHTTEWPSARAEGR